MPPSTASTAAAASIPSPVDRPARREDFRFAERLRVRWAEVDPQNIVFNGHYLMYLDTASAGYWRALAMPYAETLADLGGDLFVRRATVDYEAPARYDERIEVGLRCASIGRSSLRFAAGVFRDGQRLVAGELVYVFADPVSRRSLPVPEALRQVIDAFEAGQPCVSVETGPWGRLEAGVRAVWGRATVPDGADVFQPDAGDAGSRHAVARNRFGRPVAAARLVPLDARQGRLDRVQVHPLLQGSGIGRVLVEAVVADARAAGLEILQTRVPAPVAGFFRRQGFTEGADLDADRRDAVQDSGSPSATRLMSRRL